MINGSFQCAAQDSAIYQVYLKIVDVADGS
jgi:hypothetical protein